MTLHFSLTFIKNNLKSLIPEVHKALLSKLSHWELGDLKMYIRFKSVIVLLGNYSK